MVDRKIIAAAGTAAAAVATVAAKKFAEFRSTGGELPEGAKVYHVVPDGEDWSVQAESGERASSLHKRKRGAVKEGRQLARNQEPSRLVIHRRDGTIQKHHSYGT